jgi:hypothetical protein
MVARAVARPPGFDLGAYHFERQAAAARVDEARASGPETRLLELLTVSEAVRNPTCLGLLVGEDERDCTPLRPAPE